MRNRCRRLADCCLDPQCTVPLIAFLIWFYAADVVWWAQMLGVELLNAIALMARRFGVYF